MRSIAVMNQKGGVGKTTTAVNISAALAETGLRICLIDLDPQAHATLHLGLEPLADEPSIYDVPPARRGSAKSAGRWLRTCGLSPPRSTLPPPIWNLPAWWAAR